MILVTTNEVPGRKIKRVLGIAKGNTVRTRWFGRDLIAAFQNLIGGEVTGYTSLLTKAREEAIKRMIKQAEALGANAIVNVRFSTSQIMSGAAEILVYGTAVELE